MLIRIGCPGCRQPIECQAAQAGQAIACPHCGQRMRVPAAPSALPPPPPPPPPPPRVLEAELADDDPPPTPPRAPRRPKLPAGVGPGPLGDAIDEFAAEGAILFWIGAALAALGVVLLMTLPFLRKEGPAMLGLIAFIAGAIMAGVSFQHLGRRLVICDNGLVDCWLGRATSWTWDEVDGFRMALTRVIVNGVYSHTRARFTVTFATGGTRVYTEAFGRPEELGILLGGEIARAKFTSSVEAIQAGRWVAFGPLELGRAGARERRDVLPWNEIEDFSTNKGVLRIFPRGTMNAWASFDVNEIPNYELLVRLAEHCRRVFA